VISGELDSVDRVVFVPALYDEGRLPLCFRIPVKDTPGLFVAGIARQDQLSLHSIS